MGGEQSSASVLQRVIRVVMKRTSFPLFSFFFGRGQSLGFKGWCSFFPVNGIDVNQTVVTKKNPAFAAGNVTRCGGLGALAPQQATELGSAANPLPIVRGDKWSLINGQSNRRHVSPHSRVVLFFSSSSRSPDECVSFSLAFAKILSLTRTHTLESSSLDPGRARD